MRGSRTENTYEVTKVSESKSNFVPFISAEKHRKFGRSFVDANLREKRRGGIIVLKGNREWENICLSGLVSQIFVMTLSWFEN